MPRTMSDMRRVTSKRADRMRLERGAKRVIVAAGAAVKNGLSLERGKEGGKKTPTCSLLLPLGRAGRCAAAKQTALCGGEAGRQGWKVGRAPGARSSKRGSATPLCLLARTFGSLRSPERRPTDVRGEPSTGFVAAVTDTSRQHLKVEPSSEANHGRARWEAAGGTPERLRDTLQLGRPSVRVSDDCRNQCDAPLPVNLVWSC
jgi:hypothetical protein